MSTEGTPRRPIPPLSSTSQQQPNFSGLQGEAGGDPLFNPETHSQGGMPNLLQFLVAEYLAYMGQANKDRAEQGQEPLDAQKTVQKAKPLLAFFEAYLRTNRPVNVFPIDMNYGVQLSNHKRFAVSPGVVEDFRGSMQNSGAVEVTHGRSQPGISGVTDGGGIEMH